MEDLLKNLDADLTNMIRGGCNYPLALTLSVLTEVLGGLHRGTFASNNSKKNYEEGLRVLGPTYSALLEKITDEKGHDQLYGVLRCVSVHTYVFSRAIGDRLWIVDVNNDRQAGIARISPSGLRIDGTTIELITNTYARDLVDAFERLQRKLLRDDPTTAARVESAIRSQRHP